MKERIILLTAFLAVTVLTAVVVLFANIGFFGEAVRTSDFSKWGIGAVLAEVVGATIAVFKFSFIPIQIKVNLDFPDSVPDVNLDLDKCEYEIREGGNVSSSGKLAIAEGEAGGWQCTLPPTVTSNQIVKLNLVEMNGKKWETNPFYPYVKTQQVKMR